MHKVNFSIDVWNVDALSGVVCVVSKFVTRRSKKGKGKGKTGKDSVTDKITFEDLVKDNLSELRRILQ